MKLLHVITVGAVFACIATAAETRVDAELIESPSAAAYSCGLAQTPSAAGLAQCIARRLKMPPETAQQALQQCGNETGAALTVCLIRAFQVAQKGGPPATPAAIASPTSGTTVTAEPTTDTTATAEPTNDTTVTTAPATDTTVTAAPATDTTVTAAPATDTTVTAAPATDTTAAPAPVSTNSDGGGGGSAILWIITLAVIAVGGGVIIATRRHDRKEKKMQYLEIASPAADSVVIAGRPVTFTASFDRLDRANKIAWSVASEPGRQTIGASFTREWSDTGVDQVVASIDGLTCGIIVYVFKTPNGGDTIADLMSSAPPPIVRSVDAFPKLPARAQQLSA